MILVVFTFAMFLSATLLFLVEPMLAKMALPLLGGAPAVWNTCLVFFQAVLLAGYLYAHAATKWLGRRTQIALHLCLVLTPLAVLPIRIPTSWEPPTESSPVLWMLAMLSVAVGLPFFLLSSSTPVMQRWFAQSGHRSANDPYFLYAASNVGSLVGLLSYPFLLEPTLRLSVQSHLWTYCYLIFVLMTMTCGALVWRAQPGRLVAEPASQVDAVSKDARETELPPPAHQRLRWLALAFVPSSLMMGVTTSLTTDVPPIPLMWVLPLAIYLLSFVLVFANKTFVSHQWISRQLRFLILLALFPTIFKLQFYFSIQVLLYLSVLFAVCLFCHGELARTRPKIGRLTEFYLWISLGGVIGGVFNALIAPVVFTSVLEFPLALIFAALLRPNLDQNAIPPEKKSRARLDDLLFPMALGIAMTVLTIALKRFGGIPNPLLFVLLFGYLMVWLPGYGKRPLRFVYGLALLVLASSFYSGSYGQTLHSERSFFGVMRVTNSANGRLRYLLHGAIVHGIQSLDTAMSREPLAYYDRSGPAGSILGAVQNKAIYASNGLPRQSNWAVIGLGAGAMACYLQPGESLTFYEIDPAVERIALDPHYFTFLKQCAPMARIVLGDARMKLRDSPDESYDLIVLDAFSGDSVPLHLITREALTLYLRKLAPGGILAFHISNKHLQLWPAFAALARDANLLCLIDTDTVLTDSQLDRGKVASQWLVMARNRSDLGALSNDAHWKPSTAPPGTDLWTDDYSNLFRIISWR